MAALSVCVLALDRRATGQQRPLTTGPRNTSTALTANTAAGLVSNDHSTWQILGRNHSRTLSGGLRASHIRNQRVPLTVHIGAF